MSIILPIVGGFVTGFVGFFAHVGAILAAFWGLMGFGF
jgi:hypothetical protein